MNLGVLKVAAVLEQASVPVEMLDLSGVQNFEDVVREHAGSDGVRTFGVTATTPQLPAAGRICSTIRRACPEAKVILGGPHVTLVNAAFKREQKLGIEGRAGRALEKLRGMFDVLVAGDGEEAILRAIQPNSPRLIDADDPKSLLFLTNAQLSELPLPARHLVDTESYNYTIDGVRALSMIAQLGCPFGCGFCGGRESPFLRRVRTRPSASVVAEMVHLYRKYGVRGFMLYDDELNVNPKIVELMNLIAETAEGLGTSFRLRGFVKAELFTDEQAAAMYRAGFRWILTGFESGSARILKNINKRASRDDNTRCVEIARRHGLKVKALMSLGHPGESEQTLRETRDWLLEVRPEDFDLTIITTYPGTPYHDHAVPHPEVEKVWVYTVNDDRLYSYEIDYSEVADYYKGDPDGGYHSFVYTDYLTSEDLVRCRDQVDLEVRQVLKIALPVASPAIRYEHSMGQHGVIPPRILRASRTESYVSAQAGR